MPPAYHVAHIASTQLRSRGHANAMRCCRPSAATVALAAPLAAPHAATKRPASFCALDDTAAYECVPVASTTAGAPP
jgi:hypothetical protein